MTNKLAYVRVSTKEQNEIRQVTAMKELGIHDKLIFVEKLSGKDRDRPILNDVLNQLRPGDTLYIESISRMARNTRDFLNIMDDIRQKEANLISLKENIDTTTDHGKFMLTVFAALSELERATILDRQREGIDIALSTGNTKTGKAYGRPKSPTDEKMLKKIYRQYKEKKLTATQAAELLKITRQTFYRRVNELDSEHR